MSKVTKIQVSLGRTVNLGNYETARVDVTMTADLEKDDDAEGVYSDLLEDVRTKVKSEVAVLLGKDI